MQHYIEINRRIVPYNAQNRSKASLPYLTLSISCKRMHTHTFYALWLRHLRYTLLSPLSLSFSLTLSLSDSLSISLYIFLFFSLFNSLSIHLFSIIKSNISYARKAYNKRLQSNYTKSKACNIRLDSV